MCWKLHQTFLSSVFFNFWSPILKKRVPQICVESWLPEESEYGYAMKCIEVRQKVLLASCKSDIKYDKGLVMKLFYRTLGRGLLSSYVVQEIKPLLRSSISDEDLIAAATKAAASEKEMNLALGKKKQLKVYEVGSVRPSNSPGSSDNKVDKLVAAVELLTK